LTIDVWKIDLQPQEADGFYFWVWLILFFFFFFGKGEKLVLAF